MVELYYRTAPAIVHGLTHVSDQERQAVAVHLLEEFLTPACQAIELSDHQAAMEIYTDMMRQFGVEPT
jgi:hypothetical protein